MTFKGTVTFKELTKIILPEKHLSDDNICIEKIQPPPSI
jgi:hypothetical protein